MKKLITLVVIMISTNVYSISYQCDVTRKLDSSVVYPSSQIQKYQYSVVINDDKDPSFERCSYVDSQNKITCDKYKVDRVETDKYVGIKKFYHFSSQFDVQLYPDLKFVENNGRGGISYGECKKKY